MVLLVTFLLVVFRDLTEGILVGFGLGAMLFLHRMAQAIEVERPIVEEDRADAVGRADRTAYDAALAADPDIIVYRISGAFFFGAAAAVSAALDRIGEHPKAYVIDFSGVPILDSTAAATIAGFARKARRHGARLYLSGARAPIRRVLLAHGVRPPQVHYKARLADAVEAARGRAREPSATPGGEGEGVGQNRGPSRAPEAGS